jgi:translocation protein SEC63
MVDDLIKNEWLSGWFVFKAII